MTDFSEEGLSATVTFTSDDAEEGSMTAYLTRGMVSKQPCINWPGRNAVTETEYVVESYHGMHCTERNILCFTGRARVGPDAHSLGA